MDLLLEEKRQPNIKTTTYIDSTILATLEQDYLHLPIAIK